MRRFSSLENCDSTVESQDPENCADQECNTVAGRIAVAVCRSFVIFHGGQIPRDPKSHRSARRMTRGLMHAREECDVE